MTSFIQKKGGNIMTTKNEEEIKKDKSKGRTVSLYFQAIVLFIVAGCFLLFLYKGGVIDKCMIESLADENIARGLITFLIACGTILISLIVCVGALLGRGDDAKESFFRAKEILTILVGILGTIVGFYFGSATDDQKGKITVAEPILSVQDVVESQELVELRSYVSGGTKPYRYKIKFPDFNNLEIEGLANDNGWIISEFNAPLVPEEQKVTYHLDVQDANGEKGQFRVQPEKGFKVKPKK
jgi:hypothetical protein